MLSVEVVKALANEKRLQILHWLKTPRAHFPKQVDGDLVRDGVLVAEVIDQKLAGKTLIEVQLEFEEGEAPAAEQPPAPSVEETPAPGA